jgi:hypothetical protein
MFHLNLGVENGDDISSQKDFENDKNLRGSYLDL